jgi:hypothetical protein
VHELARVAGLTDGWAGGVWGARWCAQLALTGAAQPPVLLCAGTLCETDVSYGQYWVMHLHALCGLRCIALARLTKICCCGPVSGFAGAGSVLQQPAGRLCEFAHPTCDYSVTANTRYSYQEGTKQCVQ